LWPYFTVCIVPDFAASLKLPTYAGNFVHFSDVALACARRVIAAAVADRGENFEDIPNTHGITKRWEKLRGAAVTLQTDWSIQHFVAAEKIFSTFRVFKFRRALALWMTIEVMLTMSFERARAKSFCRRGKILILIIWTWHCQPHINMKLWTLSASHLMTHLLLE
jgi:hypothetical protein